jgi:hypothetical protein
MEYVYHHGNGQIHRMAFNSGRTDVGHQACALQVMCGVQTHSAADVTKQLDIHWVALRIVWDQLDCREVCAHRVSKNPTDDDKCHCRPFLVSIAHVALIRESNFGAEHC